MGRESVALGFLIFCSIRLSAIAPHSAITVLSAILLFSRVHETLDTVRLVRRSAGRLVSLSVAHLLLLLVFSFFFCGVCCSCTVLLLSFCRVSGLVFVSPSLLAPLLRSRSAIIFPPLSRQSNLESNELLSSATPPASELEMDRESACTFISFELSLTRM